MRSKSLPVLLIMIAAAAVAWAQDEPVRTVDNPFQEGVPYSVGDDFAPDVEIDGVRWTLMRVTPKAGGDIKPGSKAPVVVDLRFDNRSDQNVWLSVVLMLEDSVENPLQRLQLPRVKLSSNRVKEFQHMFSVTGEVLASTRRVYLFCQVQ